MKGLRTLNSFSSFIIEFRFILHASEYNINDDILKKVVVFLQFNSTIWDKNSFI